MAKNESNDLSAVANTIALGKRPNLSEKDMKNMRMNLQMISLLTPTKFTYFYNIVAKQSNWGFSQNQRLLILNVQQKSISYLSRVPQGYLPYEKYEEIAANPVKEKILLDELANFKFLPVKGKISSMCMEWTDKSKNQKKWTFIVGSSKLMNDWIGLVTSVKDGSYDKKKYEQMVKISNTSPLANTFIPPPKSYNNPMITPSSEAKDINDLGYNQKQPPAKIQMSKDELLKQHSEGSNPFLFEGKKTTPNDNRNAASSSNLQNNLSNNISSNSNPSLTSSAVGFQKSKIEQPKPQPQNTTSRVVQSKISDMGNVNRNAQNNAMVGESQFIKKPYVAKIGETQVKKQGDLGYSNQLINSKQSSNQQNNLGYSLTNNQNKEKQNSLNRNTNSSGVVGLNERAMRTQYYKQDPPRNFAQSSQKNLLNNNHNNLPSISQIPNQNSVSKIQPPNAQKSIQQSLQNSQPNQGQRTLGQSQSKSPGDFVEEIKKRRERNPEYFNLTNELSQKKFPQYPNSTATYNNQYNGPQFNESKQTSNIRNTPKTDQINHQPTTNQQNFLNRQHSGQKRLVSNIQDPSSSNLNQQQQYKPFIRNKTIKQPFSRQPSQNPLLQKQPSQKFTNNNRQKSQISRNNPTSYGVQNNYDDYQLVDEKDVNNYNDNGEIYRPNANFPESTKNLTKIRSDYLQRKAQNITHINADNSGENTKNYPFTAKNQGRLLKNNYVQENQKQKSRVSSHKYNEPSFDKAPKFDSSQKRREDSIYNLNKVNSTFVSKTNNKAFPSYNQLWLQTSNPNKKIQVHEQFISRSRELAKQIIEQLPLPQSHRQYQPIDSYNKQNLYSFSIQNLIITLHFFNQNQSVNGTQDNINVDAPVMYDQATYEEIKREFYNYNLILGVTNNQGRLKVPLCCYIEYRGILAVIKADIPQAYKQVQPYGYKQQFQSLEQMIKVRFLFNTFNCYQSQGYRGGDGKFVLLWNLNNLIPGIPNTLKNQSSYFRKQFLLGYDEILEDLQSSSEAHAFAIKHIVNQLLSKLQSLELQIIHSKDLTRQLHRTGVSLSYLPQMYKKTDSIYLKKIFMTEIVANIFTSVVRSQLNHAFAILPAQNMHNVSPQQLDMIIVDCAHVLINQLFSYSTRSENIWRLIVNQSSKRYHIIVSKQEVIPGYLLSSIVHKINLSHDFKVKSFLKTKKPFTQENIIPRDCFVTFLPSVRRFDMQSICPTYSKCKQLLVVEQSSTQNYEHLSLVLNLKTRTMGSGNNKNTGINNNPSNNGNVFPEYFTPLMQQLKTYLANFIPYTEQLEYENLDVYEYMYEQPITYNGVKTSFLAIKWLIKNNQIQKANQVFEIKFHQLSYWLGEYNTAITQFYDFFSMFYASVGDFEESICLAKSSLINVNKVLGQQSLPVADKHYQLGNIYFKINKKNEALKEYNKTKQILISHQKTTIPEYGIILLKIALLCLNFGELTQCMGNAIQAERIFQNNGGNENDEIECFEILSRVYEITRKQSDMNNLCEACSKTFNLSENPKTIQRMLKMVLFPKLCSLSSHQQKCLLPLLQRLQQHNSTSGSPSASVFLSSFNFLHKLASHKQVQIKKKVYYYLENVIILSEEINRRDLMRKHLSLNEKTSGEAEEMLVVIEAVGNIVGWGFLIGALKDAYYD